MLLNYSGAHRLVYRPDTTERIPCYLAAKGIAAPMILHSALERMRGNSASPWNSSPSFTLMNELDFAPLPGFGGQLLRLSSRVFPAAATNPACADARLGRKSVVISATKKAVDENLPQARCRPRPVATCVPCSSRSSAALSWAWRRNKTLVRIDTRKGDSMAWELVSCPSTLTFCQQLRMRLRTHARRRIPLDSRWD